MRYFNAGFASALLLVSPMSPVLLQGEVVQAQTVQDREAAAPVLAQTTQDRKVEADRSLMQGIEQYQTSQLEAALQTLQQALQIYREIHDSQGEGRAIGNLGSVYAKLGNDVRAIDYQEQSLAIAREIKDRLGEGTALGNLGLAYGALGDYGKAIDYQEQSLAIARKIKDRLGEGTALGNLGLAYGALGNYGKAIDYQEQSLAIAREIKNRLGEGTALGNLGLVYYALGNYPKAIEYHEQGLAIAREIGNQESEAGVLNNIGLILTKQKQLELAIVFYKQSVNAYESIRQNIRKLPRETQDIHTSSVEGTYRRLADLLLTQGRTQEAQAILELRKVQELRGYGKDQETNASPVQFPLHPLESQALQAFEQTIAAKALSLETLKTIGQPLSQNRDRIIQESNNTPSAIGNPQAVLQANPNALLIQNLVVGDKFWVIWTNASGKTTAIVVPNITQAQLTTIVQDFRQQIGSPYSNLDQLKATSNQLYNWLIPPQLQAELVKNPKQHLIFSLDQVTRYIPVAVLFDGNQYLAQRYTLSNLITIASDTTDRLSLNGQTPTILALGTSKAFPPTFSALPNVPAELSVIVQDGNNKGIYPGKIRLGAAFTANSLRDNREPFRVLHIATHGSFNPKNITASFLLLGDGNHLPIGEIAFLTNLNTIHLIVLSACETGLSSSTQNGTEIGISGYFLSRGAKAVIASLWSVNDASTSLMMQQFYQQLATGKTTKAEALQVVQQQFIAGKFTANEAPSQATLIVKGSPPTRQSANGDFSHPFYWAPFILIGNSL